MIHKNYSSEQNKILFNWKLLFFIPLLFIGFISQAQYRPVMGTARGYAVFAGGNLTDNNPKHVKGMLGVMNTLSGTNSISDSTIIGSGFPNDSAYYYLQEVMNELDALSGTSLTMSSGTITRGTYNLGTTTLAASGTVTLQGGANDVFVFKVNGDLEIGSDFRFILDGVQAKNIFWYVDGDLTIATLVRVYGAFYVYNNATVASTAAGIISLLAKGDVTMGSSNAFTSYDVMEPIIYPGDPCPDLCVKSNLVFNGDFSNDMICDSSANGFVTQLKIDADCDTPGASGFVGTRYYTIAQDAYFWHKYRQWKHVHDHTGDLASQFMLIDGSADSSRRVVWQQTVPVEPGKEYKFIAWFANVNIYYPAYLPVVDIFINDIYKGTINIPNDTLWRSRCIDWTAGIGITSAKIQIRQKKFYGSYAGVDFGIDDIVFGEVGEETPIITQSSVGDCGNYVLLQVQNAGPNTSYQWQLGGVNIPGATGPTYHAVASGNYTVVATISFGCIQTSSPLSVTYTSPPYDVNNYTATSSATWTKSNNPFGSTHPIIIRNQLVVQSNVNLTIKGMRFEFDNFAKVIIEDGATLTMEDSGSLHTVFTAVNCSNIMWQGVRVLGESTGFATSVGKLVMKANSKIEHARIGVDNYDPNSNAIRSFNGYVEATGAIFHNNHTAARLTSLYSISNGESPGPGSAGVIYQNKSFFQGCTFISDTILPDTITYPAKLHFTFIDLNHITGVKIMGNTFKNSFYQDPPPNVNNTNDDAVVTMNKGITSFFADYRVGPTNNSPSNENTFTNLWAGIDHSNGGKAGLQYFSYNHFLSNAYGIIVRGGIYSIFKNEFAIDPEYSSSSNGLPKSFIGINARGNNGTKIEGNTFTDGYCGIITVDWGIIKRQSYIRLNDFTNVGRINKGSGQGLYNYKNNTLVEVKCNDFISIISGGSVFVRNHWVANGPVDEQGLCDNNKTPANNQFIGDNPRNADIYVMSATLSRPFIPFQYNAFDNSADQFPKMMQGIANVTSTYVNDCNNSGGFNKPSDCNIHNPLNKDSLIGIVDSILTNDPQDMTAIPYIYEVLNLMSDSDSTYNERIIFLSGLSIDTAHWMLLPFYASKGDMTNLGELIGTLTPSDSEQLYTIGFYDLQRLLAFDTLSWKDMTSSDSLYLEEIAASNTHIAYEAQGVLSYFYNRGFSIPLPYVEDEEPARKGNFSTEQNVKIFPNPAGDELTVSFKNVEVNAISIHDILGKQVKHETVTDNGRFTINISDLRDGIYFVRIFKEGEVIENKKIVIIH